MEKSVENSQDVFITAMKKELKLYLIQIFKNTHVFCFAYLMMNKSHSFPASIISDYPAGWINQYKNHGYQKIDPVMIIACRKFSPFIWPDNLAIIHQHSFFNLSKFYRLNSGYTFTLHDGDDNLATLSLTNRTGSSDFYRIIEQNKEKFQMLLITTHEKVINFMRAETRAMQPYGGPPTHALLSPREKEVLFWASAGKTYGEVATILTIREGTVKFHIRNIIDKLGVVNAKHAISRAMELKLFS
ncbi:LuxR family quorum-sensing system transcriptional regulator ExpR [Sodalis ligni]|jgi:LuxR family quorum-sensing system transcriptional regulator ExpR|uniref:LuxR family quorum-sensing system transcriptional regulator ExpR n=2 Tax=Sodalis ligni TaxID=2697027 RepID=A0A4R1NH32_9GAMM|nr:LuxR family quorum-sensing system transcriptional regulator ExpR [Sodalis ligni]